MENNQAAIADIAKNSKDEGERIKAIEQLTDQAVLFEIIKIVQYVPFSPVKIDANGAVREAAIKKLTDRDMLNEILNWDEEKCVSLRYSYEGDYDEDYNPIKTRREIDLRETARERLAEIER